MATYPELRSLFAEAPLRNRLEVAILIKAREVLNDLGSSIERINWADAALTPSVTAAQAKRMLSYLLGGAVGLSHAEILALPDADLQAAVDAAVDLLYP